MKEPHGKSSTVSLTSVVGSASFCSMTRAYKEDTVRKGDECGQIRAYPP
jgi:hypothetical protein